MLGRSELFRHQVQEFAKAYLLSLTVLALLPSISAPLFGQSQPQGNAWESLPRDIQAAILRDMPEDKKILQSISEAQLHFYLRGVEASRIMLKDGTTLADLLASKGALSFAIPWSSVDGGAGRMAGGDFSITGVLGQPDTGRMAGGSFTLAGGVLGIAGTTSGCIGVGGAVFCDGFETGDTSKWTVAEK